jgi:hypothetical protein
LTDVRRWGYSPSQAGGNPTRLRGKGEATWGNNPANLVAQLVNDYLG